MKIAKTLFLLSAFLVGNYFIANELVILMEQAKAQNQLVVILICLLSIGLIFALLGMFALFYNILGSDN